MESIPTEPHVEAWKPYSSVIVLGVGRKAVGCGCSQRCLNIVRNLRAFSRKTGAGKCDGCQYKTRPSLQPFCPNPCLLSCLTDEHFRVLLDESIQHRALMMACQPLPSDPRNSMGNAGYGALCTAFLPKGCGGLIYLDKPPNPPPHRCAQPDTPRR